MEGIKETKEIPQIKSKTKIISLTLIGAIFLIITIFIIYAWVTTGKNPAELGKEIGSGTSISDVLSSNDSDLDLGRGNSDVFPNEEGYVYDGPIDGSASGGSGGGAGGSGPSPSPISGCVTSSISHSIEDPEDSQICLELNASICTKRQVNCSAIAHNLDGSIGGNFGLLVTYTQENGAKVTDETLNVYLNPLEQVRLNSSRMIENTDIDGVADIQIRCFYNLVDVPQIEEC
ncbi:MAG TPA: hypothetical protein VJH92_05585 [Candidatus Nanoarchaeia archaeon]|nr:hypothetical protein [Candidatus Nanoarchaeia archaeon]